MTIRENGLSHIPFHTAAEPTSAPSGHLLPREGGRIHTIPRTTAFPAGEGGERSEPDRILGKRERMSVSNKNTAFPHIVISNESEKSFPFAVKPRMREQRITGNAMLHMNWTLRCFMQTDSHKKEETRSKKRSLGSARDDDKGKRTLSHSLPYRCGANLRPFGAPPSKGRR